MKQSVIILGIIVAWVSSVDTAETICGVALTGTVFVSDLIDLGFPLQFGACTYRQIRITSNGYITLGTEIYLRKVPNFFESPIPVIASYGASMDNATFCYVVEQEFWNVLTKLNATNSHLNKVKTIASIFYHRAQPASNIEEAAFVSSSITIIADVEESRLLIIPPTEDSYDASQAWPGSEERAVISGFSYGVRDNRAIPPFILAASPLYAQYMNDSGYAANFSAYLPIVKGFSYYFKFDPTRSPPESSAGPMTCNELSQSAVEAIAESPLLPYKSNGVSGQYLQSGISSSKVVPLPSLNFGGCVFNYAEINAGGFIRLLKTANQTDEDTDGTPYLASLNDSQFPVIAPFATNVAAVSDQFDSGSSVFYSVHVASDPTNARVAELVRLHEQGSSFTPNLTLMVTYHQIQPTGRNGSITAQAAVASDGQQTVVLFNYSPGNTPNPLWKEPDIVFIGYSYGETALQDYQPKIVAALPQEHTHISFFYDSGRNYDYGRGNMLGNTGRLGQWYYKLGKNNACPQPAVKEKQKLFLPHGKQLKSLGAEEETCFNSRHESKAVRTVDLAGAIPFGSKLYTKLQVTYASVIIMGDSLNQTLDRGNPPATAMMSTILPIFADLPSSLMVKACYAAHSNATSPQLFSKIADTLKSIRGPSALQASSAFTLTGTVFEGKELSKALTYQATLLTNGTNTALLLVFGPGALTPSYATIGYLKLNMFQLLSNILDNSRNNFFTYANLPTVSLFSTNNTGLPGVYYFDIGSSLASSTLFPYGDAAPALGRFLDAGLNTAVQVKVPAIKFGACQYEYAEISSNGYIRLRNNLTSSDDDDDSASDTSDFLDLLFNDDNPIIAPFSMQTGAIGNSSSSESFVSYSIHTAGDEMNSLIALRLQQYRNASSAAIFRPTTSLVVTFKQLTPFEMPTTTITAQAVLTTNGSHTFVLFNYARLDDNSFYTLYSFPQVGYSYGEAHIPASRNIISMYRSFDEETLGNTGMLGKWYFLLDDGDRCSNDSETSHSYFLPHGSILRKANLTEITFNKLSTHGYVKFNRSVPFGACQYDNAYVYYGGFLALGSNASSVATTGYSVLSSYYTRYPIIAPLSTYFSLSSSASSVLVSQHTNETSPVVMSFISLLLSAVQGNETFTPSFAVYVTWHNMRSGSGLKHVTFQAALVTDGVKTGLMFFYAPMPGGLNLTNLAIGFAYGNVDNPALAASTKVVLQKAAWERPSNYDFYRLTNTELDGFLYYTVNTTHGACQAALETGLTWPPSTVAQSTPTFTTSKPESSLLPCPQTSTQRFIRSRCLPAGDDHAEIIPLSYSLSFGGCNYSFAHVSLNGIIRLTKSSSDFYYSATNPTLSPFSVDLVTNSSTAVCYTTHFAGDAYLEYINSRLNASSKMNITFAFVLTYYRAISYRGGQITTFQIAIFTDGLNTAFFYNYDTNNAPWFVGSVSVDVGYSYGSAVDPSGRYSTITTYPRSYEVSTYVTFGQSSNIGRLGVYYYPVRNLRQELGTSCELVTTPYNRFRESTRRRRTTDAAQPSFTVHPLAVCENSSSVLRVCRCRTPFVRTASSCLGASPDVVMFPYFESQNCLHPSPTAASSSEWFSIRFGNVQYSNFRVAAGGYIILDHSAYSATNYGYSFKDYRRYYSSSPLIAPFGAELGFYPDLSSVCYSTYYATSLNNTIISRATSLIQNYTSDIDFTATNVLVVTYDKMTRNGSTLSLRNPVPAITAQVVIISGGSDSTRTYVNFNYEFTDYVSFKPLLDLPVEDNDWQVAFDFPASYGSSYSYRDNKITKTSMAQLLRSSNSSVIDSNALDQLVGNTGLLGSWLYRVDGQGVLDPVIRRSANAAPQSFNEVILRDLGASAARDSVSPLAICNKTSNASSSASGCRCRSPYIGNGTVCYGAKPDVIMFPYGNSTNRICLPKLASTFSASAGVAGIYFGGTMFPYFKVAARGYLTLDTYYSYGGSSFAPKWREVAAYSYSSVIAAYGYDFEFYWDISNVCYSVHNVSSFYEPSQSAIVRANQLIRNYTTDVTFSADTVVVVTYEKMAPPSFLSSYFSPREAITVQTVIISSVWPRRTYVNFNYEFTDYVNFRPFTDNTTQTQYYANYTDWQQAAFDFPQGYSAIGSREPKITKWMTMPLVRAGNSTIVNANAFDQLVGNTGILGSWLFRVDGTSAVDPVVRRANNSVPQSFDQVFVNVPVLSKTVKPPKSNITMSPLASCNKTAAGSDGNAGNCKCRSPYVLKDSVCRGASPDAVMFPYAISPRNCLQSHSSTSISNSNSMRPITYGGGGSPYDYFIVGAGGFILLTKGYGGYYPATGKNWDALSSVYAGVAAYGGNLDFSDNSSVCFTLNYAGNGFQPILDRANRLIKSHTNDKTFSAQSVLVVTYEKMVSLTNSDEHAISAVPESVTAQIVIISANSDRSKTYVNFNYEFNDYVKFQPLVSLQSEEQDTVTEWEQAFSIPISKSFAGSYGLPTLLRYVPVSSIKNKMLVQLGNSSIVNPNAFDQLVGNTGILGSWLYRVDGESVIDPVVRRSNISAPQSLDEISYVEVEGAQGGEKLATTRRPSGIYSCAEEFVMLGRVVIIITNSGKQNDPLPLLNSQLMQHYSDAIASSGFEMSLTSATVNRISIESLVKLDLEVKLNFALPCAKTATVNQNLQSVRSGKLLEATVQFILAKSGYLVDTQKTQFQEHCWPPRRETFSTTCGSSSSGWWVSELKNYFSNTGSRKLRVSVTSVKIIDGVSQIDFEASGDCEDRVHLPDMEHYTCTGYSDDYAASSSSKMFYPLAIVLVIASVAITLLSVLFVTKWKKRGNERLGNATIEMRRSESRTTIVSEMPRDGLETALIRRDSSK